MKRLMLFCLLFLVCDTGLPKIVWANDTLAGELICSVVGGGDASRAASLPSPFVLKGEIALGAAPHGLALTPDERELWVTDFSNRTVSVIDMGTLEKSAEIPVERGAVNVVITQDGQRAYVTNELSHSLSVIDVLTRQPLTTIPLPDRPHGITLAPDPASGAPDQRLYIASLNANVITAIDTATLEPLAYIPTDDAPDTPIVSADGRTVWVTNYGGGTISKIDAQTLTVAQSLTLGEKPHGIVLSADQRTLYVTLQGEDTLIPIDTATLSAGAAISVGDAPHGLAVAPDGTLWTGDLLSHTSTLIDPTTGASLATLDYGGIAQPHAIQFVGNRAFVSDFIGRKIIVIDRQTQIFLPLIVTD